MEENTKWIADDIKTIDKKWKNHDGVNKLNPKKKLITKTKFIDIIHGWQIR